MSIVLILPAVEQQPIGSWHRKVPKDFKDDDDFDLVAVTAEILPMT